MNSNDWLAIDAVGDEVEKAAVFVADQARDNYTAYVHGVLPSPTSTPIESPLEAIFWVWWNAYDFSGRVSEQFRLLMQHETVCSNGERFRLDFVVALASDEDARRYVDAGEPFPLIAVEVDGHAFHEKTKEQVACRNSRDRALQQDKWAVFHFSWSELVADGRNRVGEVLDFAMMKRGECESAAGRKWFADNPERADAIMRRLQESRALDGTRTTDF